MTTENRRPRSLRATLCEIERGLFYATYDAIEPLTDEMPAYQPAMGAADAKRRIEQSLHALGYDMVIWEDRLVAPPQADARAPIQDHCAD